MAHREWRLCTVGAALKVYLTTGVMVHSKNTGVKFDPERDNWDQTPFRVNDGPKISQLDAEYDTELDQSDPIICQVYRNLTNFRVIVDPEWSLAPMDPFPGHADLGAFTV